MSDSNDALVYRERVTGAPPTAFSNAASLIPVFRSDGGGSREDGEIVSPVSLGDGQTHDVQPGERSSGYEVSAPLTAEANHPEKEDALRSTFAAAVSVTGSDIDFVASTNTIESITAGKFTSLLGSEGLMLEISGSGEAANNVKTARILAVSALEIEIDADFADLVDDTGAASVSLKVGSVIWNANVGNRYVNFLESFPKGDGTSDSTYAGYLGQWCNGYTRRMSGREGIMENFSYIGMDYLDLTDDLADLSNVTLDGVNPGTNNRMVTGVNHLDFFFVGSDQIGGDTLLTLEFSLNGNGEKRMPGGQRSARDIKKGDITGTYNFSLYHEHDPIANLAVKQRLGTTVPIYEGWNTPEGGRYVFGTHNVLLKNGGPKIGGKNTSIEGAFQGTCSKDGVVSGKMFSIQYFAAP